MRLICTAVICVVTGFHLTLKAQELSVIDKNEIRNEARKIIEIQLFDLMNNLTLSDLHESQKELIVYNSYLPSQNQIFYSDKSIVSDDINPDNTVKKSGPDVTVRKYLDDLYLYYTRSNRNTIKISEVSVGQVQQKDYPYVLVTFKIHLSNAHRKIATKYQDVYRVAELRAEKPDKQWMTLINRISYYAPPAGQQAAQTEIVQVNYSEPAVKNEAVPAPEKVKVEKTEIVKAETRLDPVVVETVKSQTPVTFSSPQAKPVEKLADKSAEIVPKKAEPKKTTVAPASPTAALERKVSKFKTQTALYRGLSLASLAGAAATVFIINSSYSKYKDDLSRNNAQLELWWNQTADKTTNGESFGTIDNYKAKPESLIKFGSPGIYFTGAGILAGGLFWLMSNKSSSEVKRYKKLLEQKRKPISISPQWDGSRRYAGIYLMYRF